MWSGLVDCLSDMERGFLKGIDIGISHNRYK